MLELLSILIEELEIYKREKELVIKKISAIEKDDIKILEEITKEEKKILKLVEEKEKERERLISKLGYKALLEYANSLEDINKRERVLKIREDLISILDEIKFYNNTAEQLVNISVGVINNVIKSITGNKEIGYKKNSKKQEVSQNNLLNTKV